MAIELICGTINEGSSTNNLDTLYLGRFQATKSATGVTEFHVYSNAIRGVKIQVYADNAGEPDALLAYNNTGQSMNIGVNTLSISSHNIVSGNYYWLGSIADSSGGITRDTTGGTSRLKAATYTTFTATDPAGTGFTSGEYVFSYALYGETGSSGGFLNRNYWWFQ
jgi:hypothetical protein